MKSTNDIKAPDGFLLGGLRLVRNDGTILFQRGYWQAPKEWIGEKVWVHCSDGGAGDLDVAPPGYASIYRAQLDVKSVLCPRTERPDAKPVFRRADTKAWVASRTKAADPDYETCKACGDETHVKEAACIHCGTTKAWANE